MLPGQTGVVQHLCSSAMLQKKLTRPKHVLLLVADSAAAPCDVGGGFHQTHPNRVQTQTKCTHTATAHNNKQLHQDMSARLTVLGRQE